MKFRKKPVVIEAFKWMTDAAPEWWRAANGVTLDVATGSAFIPTLEGTHEARVGDYIIQGIKGELYPCKPDIFAATYEPVNDPFSLPTSAKSEPNRALPTGATNADLDPANHQ